MRFARIARFILFYQMTENDIQLIEEARALPYHLWYRVSDLVEKADSAQAKEMLRQISIEYHHREEAQAGLD